MIYIISATGLSHDRTVQEIVAEILNHFHGSLESDISQELWRSLETYKTL